VTHLVIVRVTRLRIVRAARPLESEGRAAVTAPIPAPDASDVQGIICADHGTFSWKDFGTFHAVSQAVTAASRANCAN